MKRLTALAATEARLLTRDWIVLSFAFVFPPFVMLVLAGVFGTQPDAGYDGNRPDEYYVTASLGVPMIALALVGLPVALASYRERGVLRRLEAFGVPTARVVAAQALVTCGLIVVAALAVLAVAVPTYGIPHIEDPLQVAVAFASGMASVVLLGVAIGLVVPNARAAQAVGLLVYFPLYLLGGGGPPKGAMTGAMQTLSNALPSSMQAISDPWLGSGGVGGHLPVFAVWSVAALAVAWWATSGRRRLAV